MTHATSSYPLHPRIAVGAVVFKNDRVLLVQRQHAPGKGLWAIPGGKVRLGESMQQAAEREILEETGIVITAKEPVYVFDIIQHDNQGRICFHYAIIDFTADYISGTARPGDDATAVRWVAADELSSLTVSAETLNLLANKFRFK